VTPVKLSWLEGYLKEHFRFLEMESGSVIDPPSSLARFVAARWNQFPEYRYASSNPKHHRRKSIMLNLGE
jgi:hypothetical protein